MSSGGNSPMRFSARPDYDYEGGFDPSFSADINNRMRVPKNIRVAGSGEGSDNDEVNANWSRSNGTTTEKIAMQVPDRIMVTGQDQHFGSRALPRELQLASVEVPVDPEHIRIMTPPRTITLNDPPAHLMHIRNHGRASDGDDETLVVENNQARIMSRAENGRLGGLGDTSLVIRNRRGSIGYDDSDEIQAEMEHMREQLSRLTSRLLAVEDEVNSSKERETYLLIGVLAYVTINAFTWLFRSNNR